MCINIYVFLFINISIRRKPKRIKEILSTHSAGTRYCTYSVLYREDPREWPDGQTVLGLVPYDIFMLFVPIKIILILSMIDENSNNDYTFSSYKVKYTYNNKNKYHNNRNIGDDYNN